MTDYNEILETTELTADELASLSKVSPSRSVNASMLGDYIVLSHEGWQTLRAAICADIRSALHKGDVTEARERFDVLAMFVAERPDTLNLKSCKPS